MSQMQDNDHGLPGEQHTEDDIEQQLLNGLSLSSPSSNYSGVHEAESPVEADEENQEGHLGSDPQGALGLFAEAAQDMATASVELGLGRHFACVDFCNQAAEKAAQSVSMLRFGRRTTYDHDLRALGSQVSAPDDILSELERLTPFHPEAFYADTPPEEADEVINAEQAGSYVQSARKILRWARSIVLSV